MAAMLNRLRTRAGLLFAAGYFGAWFLAGVAIEIVRQLFS